MTTARAVVAMVAIAAGWFAACSRADSSGPTYTAKQLSAGVVARVGGEPVLGSEAAAVMSAQGVSPSEAVDLAVHDALFAREARERLSPATTNQIERSLLARALLESLRQEVRTTPPTREEVRLWTEKRWHELDHPSAARTIHAVALVKPNSPPGVDERARGVAEKIHDAVHGAPSAEEFQARAKAVDHGDVGVRVEYLGAVTADGRVLSPGIPPQRYDTGFAEAANALRKAGDVSPVTKSPFGYHVIYLVERVPAKHLSYAKRLEAVAEDVYTERGEARLKQLLDERRREVGVRTERSAETLMRQVGDDE